MLVSHCCGNILMIHTRFVCEFWCHLPSTSFLLQNSTTKGLCALLQPHSSLDCVSVDCMVLIRALSHAIRKMIYWPCNAIHWFANHQRGDKPIRRTLHAIVYCLLTCHRDVRILIKGSLSFIWFTIIIPPQFKDWVMPRICWGFYSNYTPLSDAVPSTNYRMTMKEQSNYCNV